MKTLLLLAVLFAALVAVSFQSSAAPPKPKIAPDFALTDPAGKKWSLHDQKAKVVVVAFLAGECPMSNSYLPALADLHVKYAEKGIAVVGVFPDPEITSERVAAHAKEYKLPFPLFAAKVAQNLKNAPASPTDVPVNPDEDERS